MRWNRLPLPALLAITSVALFGCTQTDDDDSADPIPEHPEVVDVEWISDLSGQITYLKEYNSGDLDGTDCTEVFNVTGSPLSVPPQECVACDIVYQVFMTNVEDCPGGDDLDDSGQAGFDLRQTEQEGVMWWFFEGWFDSEWTELGTGAITQDWDGAQLDFNYDFDDPSNGSLTGNTYIGEGCWTPPCQWVGTYTMDLHFDFVLPDDWYEQSQAE